MQFIENGERVAEMSEPKDPAIKLFGKTIPLPEIFQSKPSSDSSNGPTEDDGQYQDPPQSCAPCSSLDQSNTKEDGEERDADEDVEGKKEIEDEQEGACPVTSEESLNPEAMSGMNDSPKAPSIEKEGTTSNHLSTEEEQTDTSNSQEKPLKKPDKILPCPRCNSMDTKFCYYNNYNVNQPRHFCKNCQRYWTAGGTMRNVPVGAGRRKNKNYSHSRHKTVSEALQNIRADVPNGVHHHVLKTNGTVLTFGSDMTLHESMASVLNLVDKTMLNSPRNGLHKPNGIRIPVSHDGGQHEGTHSNDSHVMASNSKDDAGKSGSLESVAQNCPGFPPQVPCFPGAPWPYPWNSAQWTAPVSPPAFCPPGFPMPFYPAAPYWGCIVPGAWNPWLPQPSSPNQSTSRSGPNSPTLGKHSRDKSIVKESNCGEEEMVKENNTERSLWVPKTLRIDDPEDAAKSSIWTTLGIKNDSTDSGRELFKAFPSKGDDKNHTTETSPVLQANPAALSRSLKFHESS